MAADVMDWSAGEARRLYGRMIPSRFPATRQTVLREPIGPVFAACPWNMPLIFPARKIAEALAAGCTVVIKPAEETSATAALLMQLLHEAGLPSGVVNMLFGRADDDLAHSARPGRDPQALVHRLGASGQAAGASGQRAPRQVHARARRPRPDHRLRRRQHRDGRAAAGRAQGARLGTGVQFTDTLLRAAGHLPEVPRSAGRRRCRR